MIDEVKNDVKFYECGEKMDIISAKVLSNVMLVIFQSDNVGNGRGFNLTYQVTGEIIAPSRENLRGFRQGTTQTWLYRCDVTGMVDGRCYFSDI